MARAPDLAFGGIRRTGMTSISPKLIIGLWVLSAAVQLATCALFARRGLTRGWLLAMIGLTLNAGKSIALMVVWWSAGFRVYSEAWTATRWVHWVAVLFLLLQALWALSRVWPQGRPFAVMVGSMLALLATAAAVLQADWIVWPGRVGAAVMASRSFAIAAVLFVFWCGLVYRCLRVVTHNAERWRAGLQVALCIEIICLSVEAATQRGPLMIGAQIAKQAWLMAACWWWWRMTPAGEVFVLPNQSDMPDRAWRLLERWMEGEKRMVV